MTAIRLREGQIPEAMQWKKAAVFAVADTARPEFLDWLRAVPGGLDTVKTQVWDKRDLLRSDLYLLYGWSTSGADELRRASVDSVVLHARQVDVYVSRPVVHATGGMMGTADMQFVGWKIPLDTLPAGKYAARLLERRDVINVATEPAFREEKVAGKGYQEVANLEFAIKSAK